MKRILAASVAAMLALPLLAAAAPPPKVSIVLGGRHGHVTPHRVGFTHTGGGNISITQPTPDVLVVTMSGVAVATGSPCGVSSATMKFDLEQCFEVSFDDPKVKAAKITVEGQVVGLLRSHCKGGTAGYECANAAVACGPAEVITLAVEPHSVCGGENLSVNDRTGPQSLPVTAGKYTLHQTFSVFATNPRSIAPVKASSAEFADGGLDPLWISHKEPFYGAAKKEFGFQVTITVAEDTPAEPEPKKNGAPPVK